MATRKRIPKKIDKDITDKADEKITDVESIDIPNEEMGGVDEMSPEDLAPDEFAGDEEDPGMPGGGEEEMGMDGIDMGMGGGEDMPMGPEDSPPEDNEKEDETEKLERDKEAFQEIASKTTRKEVKLKIPNSLDKNYEEITLLDVAEYYSQQKDPETGAYIYNVSADDRGLKSLFGEIGVDDGEKKVTDLENDYKSAGEDLFSNVALNLERFKISLSESMVNNIVLSVFKKLNENIRQSK